MGTPAIPNLGKHCSVDDCRQIDFLPFTCDCCRQIYCLEHRSYSRHQCIKAKECNVTVVICPLCAKGVRLIPEEDPNITWESHVDVECDPSNYDKVTKKRTCPVPGCRGILTFSNTIKCRDCSVDHCLKHRFGPDHNCAGPKKSEVAFQFMRLLNRSRKEELNQAPGASSSSWATSFFKAASSVRATAEAGMAGMARFTPSSVRATAEAGMARLSVELNQALGRDGAVQSSTVSHTENATGQIEVCPQCNLRFSTIGALVDHVEKVHDRNGIMNMALDVCPKCSKGFRDPVTLVDHVEREHEGVLKA
ncbi:zinc finger AN1 and C2H2 domain-containing stress-associated protein 16 [Sesamum indicum]|uniref:Zinc finger AN1 and C2H2 domain-containing stress-associated protein 16 n=1 Tax=Sesamum indicum TaxID=4182 RepID=A0A6I9T9E2_SESIN|nr:zinc finger AN1 and C2H2 domain-containing stress-associated protein 16 [Sesamum indicum]